MRLSASLLLDTDAATPIPCILMLYPQSGAGQLIESDELQTSLPCLLKEYRDVYGNRCLRTILPAGKFRLESKIVALCADEIDVAPDACLTPLEDIPDEDLQFLLPSRYCQADLVGDQARQIVQGIPPGYNQVETIRGWIQNNVQYLYGTTNSSTSAVDVLGGRKGVCRDYAHVGIALCRSLDIPARMVVGYLFELDPMDLHAWFEAFIGGRWYTFDATQTIPKGNRIVIAYGKDAADVAIATYFVDIELKQLKVAVEAVG